MPAYTKYDPRVDSLVMETKTAFAPELARFSEEDKQWLAEAIHREPQFATKIAYERSHTGFIREITVTPQDLERLYQERVAG